MDRVRRETFNLEKQLPSVHLDSLRKYLQVSKHLVPQADSRLLRPTIRHPDLQPSNIFVSEDLEITSLIDWQNIAILPLHLQSGIPPDLDNSTDSASRSLETSSQPQALIELSEAERLEHLELFAKKQLHYFYMTETANRNSLHFDAMTLPFSIGRREIFQLSSAPWQGANIPLRSSLIFVKENWQTICRPCYWSNECSCSRYQFRCQYHIPCPRRFPSQSSNRQAWYRHCNGERA